MSIFVPSSADLPEQVSQPQEEAAGPVYPGPTQRQLLRLHQQARSHREAQRPQNHGPLSAGQGNGIGLISAHHKVNVGVCH